MKIEISDERIRISAKTKNLRIYNLDKLKAYLTWKIDDEAKENGASYLDVLIEELLDLAHEDDAGIEQDLDIL